MTSGEHCDDGASRLPEHASARAHESERDNRATDDDAHDAHEPGDSTGEGTT